MRRLTCQRQIETPGYHDLLFANQSGFVSSHLNFVGTLSDLYAPHFVEYTDHFTEAREHHADVHPKRLLRIDAYQSMIEDGRIFTCPTWIERAVTGKEKPDEIAKPGKYPRIIGDYGTEASLLGFRLVEFLKKAQEFEPIEYLGGHMVFCKSPEPDKLVGIFEKLISPPGRYFFVYFSDDSCLSVREGNHVFMYNLDISSCDSSHGPEVFRQFMRLFPDRADEAATLLVEQCFTPVKIMSVDNPRDYLTLQPVTPFLYSGSTITTAINNFACVLFMASIAERGDFTPDGIISGAAYAGYILTVQQCSTYMRYSF